MPSPPSSGSRRGPRRGRGGGAARASPLGPLRAAPAAPAPRCSARSALRAARRPLVRSPARPPGPPLRFSPPPLLARSLCAALAALPASPARLPPPSRSPPHPARPFPPPAPVRPPLARRGFLLPFAPGSPFSLRRITLPPNAHTNQVRSHQDYIKVGVGPFLPAPWLAPTPMNREPGTENQIPGSEGRSAPGTWVLEENHRVLVPGEAPKWGN